MVGGIYCPLSPQESTQHQYAFVQQTESHLALVHHLTKTKFNDNIVSLDIDP